jgi:hypothetical protein
VGTSTLDLTLTTPHINPYGIGCGAVIRTTRRSKASWEIFPFCCYTFKPCTATLCATTTHPVAILLLMEQRFAILAVKDGFVSISPL